MRALLKPLKPAWRWVRYNPRRQTLTITAIAIVAAAVPFGTLKLIDVSNQCPAGYYRGALHECTGISDGSYDFIPLLHNVDQAILRENQNALGQADREHDQVATVALLLPLTSQDAGMQAEIMHEVQGAYVAQYRANHDANGLKPLIRLVLANPGANSAEYQPVVQDLQAMEDAPDNLLAVAGISVSTSTTKAEVKWLTDHRVPVVGGAITADDIANTPASNPYQFPGFARAEPTNDQEAQALARFGNVNPAQAVVVQDSRADDDYITTLAKRFDADSAYQPFTFQSATDESRTGITANTFAYVTVPEICSLQKAKHINWIYYAGRQVQLRLFINALAAGCPGGEFTVLTGSAGSHLTSDKSLNTAAFHHGITLEYAAIASPRLWQGKDPGADGKSATGWADFAQTIQDDSGTRPGEIGPVSLADGQSIINYDAVLTAIDGIRALTNAGNPLPTPKQVGDGWGNLAGPNSVPGASGRLCLDNAGNPYDKPVPIVTYGNSTAIALAWPTGRPPEYPCIVPRNG